MSANNPPPASPSLMEIMQAMALVHPAPAPVAPVPVAVPVTAEKDGGVTKLIIGGVIAFIGFILLLTFGYAANSLTNLNTTVTKMSSNVDQLQKSIAELQQTQGSASQQLSDLRITNTRQDARDDAVEADLKRMKERIRMAEGQKPLSGDTGDI